MENKKECFYWNDDTGLLWASLPHVISFHNSFEPTLKVELASKSKITCAHLLLTLQTLFSFTISGFPAYKSGSNVVVVKPEPAVPGYSHDYSTSSNFQTNPQRNISHHYDKTASTSSNSDEGDSELMRLLTDLPLQRNVASTEHGKTPSRQSRFPSELLFNNPSPLRSYMNLPEMTSAPLTVAPPQEYDSSTFPSYSNNSDGASSAGSHVNSSEHIANSSAATNVLPGL